MKIRFVYYTKYYYSSFQEHTRLEVEDPNTKGLKVVCRQFKDSKKSTAIRIFLFSVWAICVFSKRGLQAQAQYFQKILKTASQPKYVG